MDVEIWSCVEMWVWKCGCDVKLCRCGDVDAWRCGCGDVSMCICCDVEI